MSGDGGLGSHPPLARSESAVIPDPAIWAALTRVPTPKRKSPTPEGAVQKAAVEYLTACRIGVVKRVNTGQAWMGASDHPWGAKGRPVRFGEVGHSDLVVESATSTRYVYIEIKRPGWKAPTEPKPGASASTWGKWRSHQSQVAFLERKLAQGHVAFFAQSLQEIHDQLLTAGFTGLPDPGTHRQRKR